MHWVRHPAPLSHHQAVIKHQNVREIQDQAVCNIGRRYFNNCSLDLCAEIYILQLDVKLKGFSLTNPTIYIFLYGSHSCTVRICSSYGFPQNYFCMGKKLLSSSMLILFIDFLKISMNISNENLI